MTLTHLQGIANNYNVSCDIDARLQSLAEESQAVALTVNRSQAAIQGDLAHLKTWVRKTQRRSRKVDMRLQALDLALSEKSRQWVRAGKEHKAQRDVISGLALDTQALREALVHLTHQVHSQGARLAALKGQLQMANPGTAAPGWTPAPNPAQPGHPGPLMMLRDRQLLAPSPTHGRPPQDFTAHLQGTQKPPAPSSHWAPGGTATVPRGAPQRPGEGKCHRPNPPHGFQGSLQLLLRPWCPCHFLSPHKERTPCSSSRWSPECRSPAVWAPCSSRGRSSA